MKRLFIIACAAMICAACTEEFADDMPRLSTRGKIYATIADDDVSRVQLEGGKTVWTKGDRILLLNPDSESSSIKEIWEFDGETGATSGTFSFVSSNGYEYAPYLFAVYPETNRLSYYVGLPNHWSGFSVPAIQRYQSGSFGPGTNLMLGKGSESEPNTLQFYNLMGYVKLRLNGSATVSSIELQGNDSEGIAGSIDLKVGYYKGDGVRSEFALGQIVAYDDTYSTTRVVTLDCSEGVSLSPDVATDFYIGIIPCVFEKGITVTVHFSDGSVMTKTTGNRIDVARNHVVPMEPFVCEPQQQIPDNEIWYTSRTGKVVTPTNPEAIDANIVDNTYSGGRGVIRFDKAVTIIGDGAFDGSNLSSYDARLTGVTLPSSVTVIGAKAFYVCDNLSRVHLPENLMEIGDRAFYGNYALLSINIPDNLSAIYDYAFADCDKLTNADLPQSLTYIGNYAFDGCSSLSGIGELHSVTYIGGRAFSDTAITRMDIPETVSYLGTYVFSGCSDLVSVSLPSTVTSIGGGMFRGCSSLTGIEIPSGVTSIGQSAFEGCTALTSIDIPAGVTELGTGAFAGSGLTYAVVPDGVTALNGTFENCKDLTGVELPANLTDLGSSTFSGCGNLTHIDIPAGITSLGGAVFKDCSRLANVDIPSSVTYIGAETFAGCGSLTEIRLPNVLESIGHHAFDGCSSLTSIAIPSGVTVLEQGTFANCSSLADINFPANLTEIGPARSGIAGDGVFFNCSSLKNVVLPKSVEYMDGGTFMNCTSLESVDLSNTDIPILYFAVFKNCSNLKQVLLPESLYNIYGSAFAYCTSLESITLPAGIEDIGLNFSSEATFYGCSSLATVYCKAIEPPSLGNSSVFTGTPPGMKIYVPRESIDKYKTAQYWAALAAKLVEYDF